MAISFLDNEKLNKVIDFFKDKISKSGGQINGSLTTTQTTFTEDQELVTKKYVDDNAGSGSSGSGYAETILWENTGNTNPASVTLSHSYIDYDQIVVIVAASNGGQKYDKILPVSEMATNMKIAVTILDSLWLDYFITDQVTLTYSNSGGLIIQKVIGINYNQKQYTTTTLYTASDTTSIANTITLLEAYTNFDELIIINNDMPNSRLITSDIQLGTINPMSNAISFSWLLGDVCASTRYVFTSTTQMEFAQEIRTGSASGNNIHYVIAKVIGVKY